MYRTDFWTLWEKARVWWFARIALKHVNYHMWNESPIQVWCMIQDAWGCCTGMTQRDGIGEGDGREFRMGTHVHLWLIHVSVWQRPPQYCKVIQFSSVAQSCPTRCDPMNRSTPGLPVHHQLSESTQTHIHRVSDVIQPSHPLSPPSPPALNLSQHQGLFKWVSSSYQVAKVTSLQLKWIN